MKLASLDNGRRDGGLVIVSRDLARCLPVPELAATLQAALDDWHALAPPLAAAAESLERDPDAGSPFDPRQARSPLPRAFQWADGSAYVNHVELVRKARGAELPESFWTDPLMYQGGSDGFVGPRQPILAMSEDWGIDLEAEVAVITDDVDMGTPPELARERIRLVMLVNDVSLRNLIPAELAKGFGFFQSKPASTFSLVAVTPDELGDYWDGARLHRAMRVDINGEPFGRAEAGVDMTFDFGQLIAHAARTRFLEAGSIIGSGTVSNRDPDGGPGKPVADGGLGYSCIAEIRMIEKIRDGEMKTPFLSFGDTVRIDMLDDDERSIFGAIEQQVRQYQR
jgi:fumarylacetoacetate (FAA) hydrolase